MGDKRKVTIASITVVLDGEVTKPLFNGAFIPAIRRVCVRDGQKYAPEVWLDTIETREMEVIGK